MLRAAIYLRVSTAGQAEKGTGLDVQLDKCRKMCESKDYIIVDEYKDEGVSGTVPAHNRKGFTKLLKDIEDGEIDVMVFYSFDRLAREIRVFLEIIDKMRQRGIQIVSCKENIDTATDNGDFMMNIYASIANLEYRTIISRLSEGKKKKKATTGYVGGRLPFSYKAVNKKVVVDDEKAKIVREIFTCYNKMNMSYNSIAKHLNDMNIPTPSNKGVWYAKTISRIVNNEEKYKGELMNNNVNGIKWPKILD